MAVLNTKRSATVFQCNETGGSSPHPEWPVRREGRERDGMRGREREREEGEQNTQS